MKILLLKIEIIHEIRFKRRGKSLGRKKRKWLLIWTLKFYPILSKYASAAFQRTAARSWELDLDIIINQRIYRYGVWGVVGSWG